MFRDAPPTKTLHRGGAEGAEKIERLYQREQTLCELCITRVESFRGVRKFYDANVPNRKFYLTTKHTKATKVSDIDISKLS
jgi:hypothetical protein